MRGEERKLKILVVEDDDAVRMVTCALAREEGHEVRDAANGAEGFKAFEAFQPDLIFSDISMPVMDGLQMLEKIRRVSNDVVVIMTTALDTAEFTLKALRLRANDYLIKPVMERDIIANLKKYGDILATRTVEREVYGMILHREMTLRLGNRLEVVSKVVDRLMQETEGLIPREERLGIHLGLVEIIVNAIEHGNLGITYDEKTVAMEAGTDAWNDLVAQRLSQPPYKDRNALIRFRLENKVCEWTITDEGTGFNWQDVPDPNNPENLLAAHGRGIMITRLNFTEVTYVGKGNQVILRKEIAIEQ